MSCTCIWLQVLPDHRMEFVIAETYGNESYSIQRTVELTRTNISAYIGPQETCIHEARIASVFNLPMISYVSLYVASTHGDPKMWVIKQSGSTLWATYSADRRNVIGVNCIRFIWNSKFYKIKVNYWILSIANTADRDDYLFSNKN